MALLVSVRAHVFMIVPEKPRMRLPGTLAVRVPVPACWRVRVPMYAALTTALVYALRVRVYACKRCVKHPWVCLWCARMFAAQAASQGDRESAEVCTHRRHVLQAGKG